MIEGSLTVVQCPWSIQIKFPAVWTGSIAFDLGGEGATIRGVGFTSTWNPEQGILIVNYGV